jgi:succinate dehydrogenase / fumarate reductase flavoprotein subunit
MPKVKVGSDHAEFKKAEEESKAQIQKLLSVPGKRSVDSFHRELGHLLWEYCGMARNEAGLKKALLKIPALREEFWKNVRVLGDGLSMNRALEKAGRVADFLEFAELLCQDALERKESCGGHFREEYQTADGEAKRDDANFSYVSAWQFQGVGRPAALHKEPLVFENLKMAERSYK